MHISLRLRRWISLHSLVHDYSRRDNLIIHHGLMGSSKNFRTISKNSAVSDHVNSHLIDARNHGT